MAAARPPRPHRRRHHHHPNHPGPGHPRHQGPAMTRLRRWWPRPDQTSRVAAAFLIVAAAGMALGWERQTAPLWPDSPGSPVPEETKWPSTSTQLTSRAQPAEPTGRQPGSSATSSPTTPHPKGSLRTGGRIATTALNGSPTPTSGSSTSTPPGSGGPNPTPTTSPSPSATATTTSTTTPPEPPTPAPDTTPTSQGAP